MPRLTSHAQPVTAYADAVERIAALQALDDASINPLCRTVLLTHGRQVENAVVFLHGFTNCPQQFRTLAQNLFDLGWNVLVPRMPCHGCSNRLTDDIMRLSADELATFTDSVIDAAHGLGEHVTVAGLSLGGNMALWAAMQRDDIDRVVAVAPLLG
ncbi:MAG: alpha/beta fold hydrolase, partial [Chloroflexi bacterium]|nr:alpha/beta fold hydrolase [Chloroflexota bacterium]